MSGIQQIQSDVVRTHHNIIAAVADDKRVRPLGNRFIHHLTAGTTADSDTPHHFSAVCHANTAGIQRQLDVLCKLLQRHRARQIADASEVAAFACAHVYDIGKTQRCCEQIIDTGSRAIHIGVHANAGNALLNHRDDNASGDGIGSHAAYRGKNDRMMCHNHIAAALCRFLYHGFRDVQRAQHAFHTRLWISDQQADIVPVLRQLIRRCLFQTV